MSNIKHRLMHGVDFDRVSVIGLGLMGGSILKKLSSVGVGYDPHHDSLRLPHPLKGAESLEEAVEGSQLVIIATPPHVTAEAVLEVLKLNKDATVLDICSAKEDIYKKVKEGDPQGAARYVPAHPLCGSEKSGFEHSDPKILENAPWAVCSHKLLEPKRLYQAIQLISYLKGWSVGVSVSEHDQIMAYSSHLMRISAAALAGFAPEDVVNQIGALHAGGFRDSTRLAASSPINWREILYLNRDAASQALSDYINNLEEVKKALDTNDNVFIDNFIEKGRSRRELIIGKEPTGRTTTRRVKVSELEDFLIKLGKRGGMVRAKGPLSGASAVLTVFGAHGSKFA